ncbi:MAG: DUF3086 domain-containing protein [Waterburya sp.]
MNSDNQPIPESDQTNFEAIELEDEQQPEQLSSESKPETKPEPISDAWLEEEIIDVTIEPQTQAEIEELESETVKLESVADQSPELNLSETIELSSSTQSELSLEVESEPLPEVTTIDDSTDSEDHSEQQVTSSPEEPEAEPEFTVDRWLDESETDLSVANVAQTEKPTVVTNDEIIQLEQQKAALNQEIEQLKAYKEQLLSQQLQAVQENIGRLLAEGTRELQERKMTLQIEIEKLERRKERINQEMRSNFAGSSQELAVRVQGFKDYLVGSLQDLARAADKLELVRTTDSPPRNRERPDRVRSRENPRREEGERIRSRDRDRQVRSRGSSESPQASSTQFSEPTFADQSRRIRQLLDKYRNSPDYYGSPWQLRRTFEPIHAKRVQDWFFVQGGRGAIDSTGSRLQNILVASAVISILYNLYSDRCRVLVLTDTPENLGEWRRGLQDCLGISRNNFGTNRGVVLFDSPEILVQRAERLLQEKLLPIIIVDETEELLNLSVLKFPLWLAFASNTKPTASNYLY